MGINSFRALAGVSTVLVAYLTLFSEHSPRDVRAPTGVQPAKACVNSGQIAFTFDEGPGPSSIAVIEGLRSIEAKATFHVVTKYFNDQAVSAALKYAYAEGHLIGLRFPTTLNPLTMTDAELIQTLRDESQKIFNLIGQYPKFLRMPAGTTDSRVLGVARDLGFVTSEWNIDSNDYAFGDKSASETATTMKTIYINELSKLPGAMGAYIALHRDLYEAYRRDPSLLPLVIKEATNRGYKLVTMEKCLGEYTGYRTDNGKEPDNGGGGSGLGPKSDASTTSRFGIPALMAAAAALLM